jgi:Helix-turn-helix
MKDRVASPYRIRKTRNEMRPPTKLETLVRARAFLSSGAARVTRQAAGIRLSEVGREMKKPPSTIYRWETCLRSPRGEDALRLVRVLEGLVGEP